MTEGKTWDFSQVNGNEKKRCVYKDNQYLLHNVLKSPFQ